MMNYKSNIQDYILPEYLEEETAKIGEELSFLPEEEIEANFCTLESIETTGEDFTITLAIENEWTGERYKKTYQIREGSEIEMNMLLPNMACFLPPTRIPVLAKITGVSSDELSLKAVGILEEYAEDLDKKVTELKAKA